MYFNWFTHDFKTIADPCDIATYTGAHECTVTKINEFQSAVQFKYEFLGCIRTFIVSNYDIFNTKKEAFEAAKNKIKGNIETLNKVISIIDEDIANENNIS